MRKVIDLIISLVLGYIVGELVTYSIQTVKVIGSTAPKVLGQMGIMATAFSIIAIIFVSTARQRYDTAQAYISALILAIIIKSMDISTINIELTSPAMIIIPMLVLIYITAAFRPQQGDLGGLNQ